MSLDLTDWQNKKYTTRDGTTIRLLCVDGPGLYPVVGVWVNRKGDIQIPPTWSSDGKYLIGSCDREEDLINAKTKKEGWVNIYKYNTCIVTQGIRDSLAKAQDIARMAGDIITTVHIEWEE